MTKQVGAAGLCQKLLHLTLDKTNDVRCSNWETRPLSAVQKAYAATDAFAALAVYQVSGHSFIRILLHSSAHSSIHFRSAFASQHHVLASTVYMHNLHISAQFLWCLAGLGASAAQSTDKGTQQGMPVEDATPLLLHCVATAQLAVHLYARLWVPQTG